MKYFYLFLLMVSGSSFAQNSSPKVDPDKFTICAITINSDDEKKIFQAQAAKDPKKFNPVIELTDMGDDKDWFSKACSSGIRCDQLVISGHYAGQFFGEKGNKTLSAKELEEAGCSNSCEGVLGNPLEVFLFGCNTLAGKEADNRTPAQYLQVLLRDGIPLAQAEMVVESRYSGLGDSNKSSMQRAFGGPSKQIYGFHSVGPSGKNVKGFLENYFSKIKTSEYLEKLQAKRMLGQVETANKVLAESLKNTAFAQCNQANPQDEKTKKICSLANNKLSHDQKLALTVELLGQEDFLTYLPVISHYISNLDKAKLTDSQLLTLGEISNNKIIKNQVIGLVDKTQGLGLKSEWASFAYALGFLDKDEAFNKIMPSIRNYFKKPITEQDAGALCSLEGKPPFQEVNLTDSDVANSKPLNKWDIVALSCLTVKDPDLIKRALKFDPKKDSDLQDTLYYLATSNLPEGSVLPPWMNAYFKKQMADNKDQKGMEYFYLDTFRKFFPKDQDALKIANKVLDGDLNYNFAPALDTLKRFKAVTPDTSKKLMTKIEASEVLCTECMDFLMESKGNKEIEKFLSNGLNYPSRMTYKSKEIFNFIQVPVSDPVVAKNMTLYFENNCYNFKAEDWKKAQDSGIKFSSNVQMAFEMFKKGELK